VLHLQFKNPADYDRIHVGSKVILRDIRARVEKEELEIPVEVDGETILTLFRLTPRLRQYQLAGSAVNYVRQMFRK
jgi:hypothetical protein